MNGNFVDTNKKKRSNKFHYVIFRFNTSTDTRYAGETNLTFCTIFIYIVICVLNTELRLNTFSVALTRCGVCVRQNRIESAIRIARCCKYALQ